MPGRRGTYCRGGPTWPPLRGIRRRGGHGGPPLQNVLRAGVDFNGVFFTHAVAVVLRREGLDGALRHRDPLVGDAIGLTVVEKRYDFQFKRAIKRFGVERVYLRNLRAVVSISNRETIGSVITFEPPAVEYR